MKKVFEKSFLILSLLTILSAGCSEFSIRKKFGCYPDYYIPDTKESRKYPWWRSNSERFGSYVNGVYVPKCNRGHKALTLRVPSFLYEKDGFPRFHLTF